MLLTPSDFVRDWYSAHGAPARNLRVARWGVFPPAATARRSRVDDGAVHLLYVGGLAPNKGVHVVLEALRGVTGAVRMAIAGDEATHPVYASRLRHLADERVTFLGRLDRQQVWQAMADADAVVVPSLWHETFCLVAHEALAAGAPVIASAMGALTEAVRNGVDGLLLAPGDVEAWRRAIQRCVDEPHLLPSLRSRVVAPRAFVEHVDQVEALYREILPAMR
jgi:glycosyltransferase involved in cell wall biosynthesis